MQCLQNPYSFIVSSTLNEITASKKRNEHQLRLICNSSLESTPLSHLASAQPPRHFPTRYSPLATRHSSLATHHSPLRTKKPELSLRFFLCSGGQTRTDDLWVMSPTSYQLLHPAISEVFPSLSIGGANIHYF